MRKLVKVAFVAGAAGATAGAVQAFRKDESTEVIAQKAMKGAGEAAAVGALVGFVLDRRDKKRRKKLAASKARFGGALATGGIVEAARAARPALEHALDLAADFAEATRPKVEHAYEVARPKVEHAAKAAREKAYEAAESARRTA